MRPSAEIRSYKRTVIPRTATKYNRLAEKEKSAKVAQSVQTST